jgi:hypothetical protein
MLKQMTALSSVMFLLAFSCAYAKGDAAAVWQRISAMETSKQFGMIKVDADVNISNKDIKARYGEPTKVAHYKLGHPPTTGSIWTYRRASSDLEFRFFVNTKHVNQIELKRRPS